MESQVFVVKNAMNAEASSSFDNPHYVADALDAQFSTALSRGGKKNFNPNTGADGRAFTAEDQGSIDRHIVGEASIGVFSSVVPVENRREP
jgi:hypothetical protein